MSAAHYLKVIYKIGSPQAPQTVRPAHQKQVPAHVMHVTFLILISYSDDESWHLYWNQKLTMGLC